jgi:hypothetical protein
MTNIVYNRTQATINYILDRTSVRMAAGENDGDALMNTIAVVDPDLYADWLGGDLDAHGYHSNSELGRDRIADLVDGLYAHYENPKNWRD